VFSYSGLRGRYPARVSGDSMYSADVQGQEGHSRALRRIVVRISCTSPMIFPVERETRGSRVHIKSIPDKRDGQGVGCVPEETGSRWGKSELQLFCKLQQDLELTDKTSGRIEIHLKMRIRMVAHRICPETVSVWRESGVRVTFGKG